MQSEICPSFGLICRTTFADLHIPHEKIVVPLDIYMTKTLSISNPPKLVPIAMCIELLKRAEQSLKLLKTHPSDATLIGIPAVQFEGLEVSMARTERKQKDLIEDDLIAQAEAEADATRSALLRLSPVVNKARNNDLSAEELLTALHAEPDQKIARERFLSQRAEPLTLRDETEVLARASSSPLPKSYRAGSAYQLKGRVTSADFTSFAVCFVLLDGALPDSLFTAKDSGQRTVLVQSNDFEDLKLMSLCMTYSVDVVLELALLVNIGGAGLAYSGTAIRVMDQVIVKAAIEKAMYEEGSGLFDN